MFLGMNDQQLERIQEIFERSYYENELIFYVTEKPLDDETIAWANMISPTLNYLIVNTDTINTVEAILAFVIEEYAKNPNVIYISFNGAQNAVSKLISHVGTPVLKSVDELSKVISYMSENPSDTDDDEDLD